MLFKSLDAAGLSSSVVIQNLDDNIAELICSFFKLEKQDEIHVATSCMLGHYSFKPGCFVATDFTDGKPQFGEVLLILCVMNAIYLAVKCSKTLDFDEHYYAFNTEETPLVSIIPLEKLRINHPLACHVITVGGKEMNFVNTRYKLF